MATQVSNDPQVNQHYALQAGITAALVQALHKLWSLIDLTDLAGSLPRYKTAVEAVIHQYSLASTSFGADYFDAMRAQAGVTSPFRTPMIDPPPAEQIQASLGWATADLQALAPALPADLDPSITQDLEETVQQQVEAASQKLVADAGRNELIAAIEADTQAHGYARVAKPGACYFCRMLATRGAVYHSRESAGVVTASTHLGNDARGEVNRYHNNCHCTVVPLFGKHYEPPAHTRADQALWNDVTKGLHGKDAVNAFRRAVEGRSDGPTRASKTSTQKAASSGFDALTPEQLRHQLDVMAKLPDTDWKTAQTKRVRDRLAELG